jgi:hypothetical protein
MLDSSHTNGFVGSGGKDAQVDGFNNITMQYTGTFDWVGSTDPDTHEAAGKDLGAVEAGLLYNFALEGLVLGGDEGIAFLVLTDTSDNAGDAGVSDALYVRDLTVGAGSTLDVDGLNLYYLNATIDGNVIDTAGGGGIHQIVSSTPDGDFDGDGDVDGADFLIWQRDTSVGDLADWQDNFGTASLAEAVAAVPEPNSICLLALGLFGLLGVRRR